MMNGLGVECLKNIHFYFQNEYFVKKTGIILKMKTNYLLEHFNYLTLRTSIGAESAMPILVYFYIIMINKCQQSAAQSCLRTFELRVLPFGKISGIQVLNLLNKPTDRTFGNRRGKYKEIGKKVPQAYRVYVEDTFLACDAVIARRFKRDDAYGKPWR